ncbi:hypothetical protein [Natronobiforma cellulositropha]|uniref:hypothetical protein n=1 Tax=Natronobiforma cellulositropha TaxID=1679076 RepID=UPI0021D584C1|nr:hypothetical protein [Natronobiforma cellulositropha]
MTIRSSLPDGPRTHLDMLALERHERVTYVESLLEYQGHVISFLVTVGEETVGLHCDRETSTWREVARGPDRDEVRADHEAWLEAEIDTAALEKPADE